MLHALINPTGGNPVGPCGLAVQAFSKCRPGMDVPASLHAVHAMLAMLAMHRMVVIGTPGLDLWTRVLTVY